jgi:hypothetical protein
MKTIILQHSIKSIFAIAVLFFGWLFNQKLTLIANNLEALSPKYSQEAVIQQFIERGERIPETADQARLIFIVEVDAFARGASNSIAPSAVKELAEIAARVPDLTRNDYAHLRIPEGSAELSRMKAKTISILRSVLAEAIGKKRA